MHIKTALQLYKTKTRLASVLGVSAARVSQWGESVPELYACKLQIVSNGRLSASLKSSPKSSPTTFQDPDTEIDNTTITSGQRR